MSRLPNLIVVFCRNPAFFLFIERNLLDYFPPKSLGLRKLILLQKAHLFSLFQLLISVNLPTLYKLIPFLRQHTFSRLLVQKLNEFDRNISKPNHR